MSGPSPDDISWHRGLVFRVTLFLTLALAPIGVVGIIQTLETQDQARRTAELSLLALTSEAASREKRVVERSLGAAEALGPVTYALSSDIAACSTYLTNFISVTEAYVFAGFIPPSGVMECSTADAAIDFSTYENFQSLIETPRSNVEANRSAPGSGLSVIVVSQPVYDNGDFVGYLSLSVAQESIAPEDDLLGLEGPLGLITFNTLGDLLTTERGYEIAEADLPAGLDLATLVDQRARTFNAVDTTGEDRVYAVVPLVPNVAYALGTWRIERPIVSALTGVKWSAIYPILMWLATILVAFFALNRLVIKPVRLLQRDMLRFAQNRELRPLHGGTDAPHEIASIQEQFHHMAATVVQEEADLENLVRQKDELLAQRSVLLKEVHHRVKNNLQLISSIMNMQMRSATQPETEHVLRRLQDRLLGLAGIHRRLYQTDKIDKVDAAKLLDDLAGQTEAMMDAPGTGVSIVVEADSVMLLPDQAVPFSLLVSELLTNAVKYGTRNDRERTEIRVSMSEDAEGEAMLKVSNPIGDTATGSDGTGLGMRLIRAFVTQLDGEVSVDQSPDRYETVVRFRALEVMPDAPDY